MQVTFVVESKADEGCRKAYSDRDRSPETVYNFESDKRKLDESALTFTTTQVYTVYRDGSVELQSSISTNNPSVVLPRIGYVMELPASMKNFHYYGRGPVNNYNDRKTGQFIEHHQGVVGQQDIMLPKPQSMGNREEVRWCALVNDRGWGAAFVSDSVMSVSALPWTQQQLTLAAHPHQLPQSNATVLHLDAKVTGLGGASCGQGGPLGPDRTMSENYDFGFIIRPLTIGRAAPSIITETAKVSSAGERPINISRSRTGQVTLSTAAKDRTIMYSIEGENAAKAKVSKKAAGKNRAGQEYTGEINLRKGGTITAWYKENNQIKVKKTFDPITSVPLEVFYVSSAEPGEGNAKHLLDGDLNTIWHTTYGVTLAKYPHWVDFDAAEVKNMKGFTFTPRQSGQNGWIKDYEIYVSNDGKNWGEPIHKGSFERNSEKKTVMFSKPVKARYIRFRALNEHGGNDYASGAEFSLIAD